MAGWWRRLVEGQWASRLISAVDIPKPRLHQRDLDMQRLYVLLQVPSFNHSNYGLDMLQLRYYQSQQHVIFLCPHRRTPLDRPQHALTWIWQPSSCRYNT